MTTLNSEIPGFTGELSSSGPAFEDTLAVWNQAQPRRPALVAHCESADDVVAALRHARAGDIPVSVRAGGHSYTGAGIVDGGLVLDLRRMRWVEHDAGTGVVRVGGGAKWAEVDDVLGPLGLATASGSVSTVGVAGFTLGTGVGWLGRSHGTAGDNLVGATVVTADGEVLDVDEDTHPDLFWALRGGCGNYGVVTELRFRVHAVGTVLAGPVVHRVADAARVIAELAAGAEALDERASWSAVLTTAPPLPGLPADLVGETVLLVPLLWVGDLAAGESVLAPLRAVGDPVLDLVSPTPFGMFQRASDAAAPDGWCWDVRSEWLGDLDQHAIEAAVQAAVDAVSPLSEVLFRTGGGALARSADRTPFSFGHARYLLEVIANWAPGEDPEPARAWMRRTWEQQAHNSVGGPCVNHIGFDEADRILQAYTPEVFARLREVKRTYDPTNVFWSVQNIRPS